MDAIDLAAGSSRLGSVHQRTAFSSLLKLQHVTVATGEDTGQCIYPETTTPDPGYLDSGSNDTVSGRAARAERCHSMIARLVG